MAGGEMPSDRSEQSCGGKAVRGLNGNSERSGPVGRHAAIVAGRTGWDSAFWRRRGGYNAAILVPVST
jgi:hypothetical protein